MMSVVGMSAGEREAVRAEEAAADEICARVFSCLILSWCLVEADELDMDDGSGEDIDERSFSLGSEFPRLELTLFALLADEPRPLVLLLLVPPPLDLDDLELLSRCEDEDEDDEDEEGSLSWPLFVPETLFTFLLYLSFSLVLPLEEDALVLLLLPGIVLLPVLPEPIPDIPEDEEDVDWLFVPREPLPPLIIPPEGPERDDEPAELFEALEDFRCFEEEDEADVDEDPASSPPGIRLFDFMLPLLPLLLLPPMALPLECCCPDDGGSSSFSGDDGPSLEFVSWLIGLYGGIVLTLPPFFNLL